MSELGALIQEMLDRYPGTTFTLELASCGGQGQWKPCLCAHSEGAPGSAMAGAIMRSYLRAWDSWDQARTSVAALRLEVPGFEAVEKSGPHPAPASSRSPMA